MKSLTLLWNSIAVNEAVWCRTSAHLDIKTVQERSKNEGISFLTISLPNFARDFERCLELGYVDDNMFLGFKKHACLPAFLSGFTRLVFDRSTGVLLTKPSVRAIKAVRQLTLVFSKILMDCKPRRVAAAYKGFLECEQEVREASTTLDFKNFQRVSTLLYGSLFSKVDRKIFHGQIEPHHGPGATADSLSGNQKFRQAEWPWRLEYYFPYGEMVLPNWSYWDLLDGVDFLEPGRERPVKVIHVPKTMKTPRIIAIEPTAMQYAQQAVLRLFRRLIKDSFLNEFIGMDDQTPNQRAAKRGSLHGDLATLDLSEASDRVSLETVQTLLSRHRHFHDAVMSCRSTHARLPSGDIVSLAKFASMGSALCFPMEAAVFLVVVFLGIEQDLGHRLSKKDVKSYLGRVRIFGDDIVVPVDHVHSVIRSLESFGLKVNEHKSFWNGKFRESCGKEYYDGSDVSIVRCRRTIPSSRKDVQEIVSAVSLRNQLFFAGLEDAAFHIDRRMLKLLGHFPFVRETSPVLGRHGYGYPDSSPGAQFVNSVHLVRGWILHSPIPLNEIDGWPALRKCLALLENSSGEEIATSSDHLRRSGRPRVAGIRLGMGPIGL